MKVILTYMLITLSIFELHSQELNGYFMRQGLYSIEDSSYLENNISGNSIIVEFFNSQEENTNVIRIGHKTKIGTTFHDYVVIASEIAKTDQGYNIIVAEDSFGGDIALKYNDDDFVLLFNYSDNLEKWTGFYAGILLNENTISFLSSKVNLTKK